MDNTWSRIPTPSDGCKKNQPDPLELETLSGIRSRQEAIQKMEEKLVDEDELFRAYVAAS